MANQTMTASEKDDTMSDGQIDSLANSLRDAARKHREEIPRNPGQEALGTENLGMMMFAVYRKLVEEISKRIVHIVTVNRKRSTLDSLKACGRKLYVNEDVVATAPRGTGETVKMTYFVLDRSEYKGDIPTCAEVDDGYKRRKLKPDLQAQTDDNAKDPTFADTKRNACQWKDAQGNWCYATFHRWPGERLVNVLRDGRDWHGRWSFGGVPEESSASAV